MLKNKNAIVTGASRGLGRAIALALARAGARVALVARSSPGLAATAEQIAQIGGEARAWAADLARAEDVDRCVKAAGEWMGHLDALVNNAGVIEPLAPFAEARLEDWLENLTINVAGTARFTHECLPLLRNAPSGAHIVTISSGAAVSSIPGWSAYCTAKAALDRWALVLDAELQAEGVRSFSFAPGTIDTQMQTAIRGSGVGPARLVNNEVEHLPAEIPAQAVAFLCTAAAAPLAGEHIDIRYPEVRRAIGLPELA